MQHFLNLANFLSNETSGLENALIYRQKD